MLWFFLRYSILKYTFDFISNVFPQLFLQIFIENVYFDDIKHPAIDLFCAIFSCWLLNISSTSGGLNNCY